MEDGGRWRERWKTRRRRGNDEEKEEEYDEAGVTMLRSLRRRNED